MNDLKMIFIYLIGVNVITFILMGVDKRKAKKQQWRIPERTFWSLAVLGGAIGGLIAMKTFRHKTKHRSFIFGMPILLVIHLILLFTYFSMS